MLNDDKEFQEMLEEIVDDPEKVDAIMELLKKKPEEIQKELRKDPLMEIDLLILREADWQRRAQLAALKISSSLE